MTETPAPDLRALRELAEAATPGPWIPLRSGSVAADEPGRILHVVANTFPTGNCPKHNAAFIAAANPTAVLALVERVEAAEAAVERVRKLADAWHDPTWSGRFTAAPFVRAIRAALDADV